MLTLGRYPRLRKSFLDYTDIQLVVFVGVLAVFGLVVLLAKLWPGMVQAGTA